MVTINYMASRIRAMVSQLKSNSENKAFTDAQYMNIGLRMVGDVPTLQMETDQPSFHLCLSKPLLDVESAQQGDIQVDCTPDNNHVWRVRTVDLDHALACLRQQTALVCLQDDGSIQLSANGNFVTLEGELLEAGEQELGISLSAPTLKSSQLIRGLSAALEVASVKGNDLEKSGIHLSYSPDGLLIEGANPLALAVTEYGTDVWQQSHQAMGQAVLTTDAVRHLVRSLASMGDDLVRLQVQDDLLVIESQQMVMMADLQPVNYFDSSEFRCRQYPTLLTADRLTLLQGLYGLRTMGQTQVHLHLQGSALTLAHVDAAHATCTTSMEATSNQPAHLDVERQLPIAPLTVPLSIQFSQSTCQLGYHTDDCPLCLMCGETKIYVK